MPETVGPYGVAREPKVESEFARPGRRSLVSGGRMYMVRDADAIQGSVEIAVFKPGVDAQKAHMQEGIERGLGTTAGFRVVHYGITEVRVLQTPEQQVFLWFPPSATPWSCSSCGRSSPTLRRSCRPSSATSGGST
jgi:hypothetical protein